MSSKVEITKAAHTPLIVALIATGTKSFASKDITERQLECLDWAQQGKSASDIGGIIGISGRTVEKHLAKLCHHLGVRTRLQAVLKARDLGLIDRAQS